MIDDSDSILLSVIATHERDYVSGRLAAEIWDITAEEWRPQSGEL